MFLLPDRVNCHARRANDEYGTLLNAFNSNMGNMMTQVNIARRPELLHPHYLPYETPVHKLPACRRPRGQEITT